MTAGLPDAETRLQAASAVGKQNDWAAACLARASGRLHRDPAMLAASAKRWQRIGADYERACSGTKHPGPFG